MQRVNKCRLLCYCEIHVFYMFQLYSIRDHRGNPHDLSLITAFKSSMTGKVLYIARDMLHSSTEKISFKIEMKIIF